LENIKFSKSLLDIVEIKSDFTDENHKYFQEALKINEV
jgi:hypothetical protein